MLGVLLATARPGQRAPGARQTVNLVACGLAIRARRALVGKPWQDALAVVSLIAPVLMLIIAALAFAVAVRQVLAVDLAYPLAGPFWQLGLVPRLGAPAAVLTGWLAAVLLELTGRRLPLFLCTAGVGPVVMASLAACSLGFSAGPRRGLAIAGRRRVYRGALARQLAVRRARVAGGDRVLAGAGQAIIPCLTWLSRPVRPRWGTLWYPAAPSDGRRAPYMTPAESRLQLAGRASPACRPTR
jgi:hypothetical protein